MRETETAPIKRVPQSSRYPGELIMTELSQVTVSQEVMERAGASELGCRVRIL